MSLVGVEDLETGYGALPVLHGVSVSVAAHELVALVGPNGAGKTSLLKAIFGLLPINRGRVTFAGSDITELRQSARQRLGMALIPQIGGTFPDLSVEDNLRVSYSSLDKKAAQRALEQAYEMFPVLGERCRQLARTLSGGERQMLTFVSGIGGEPKFLALDEPTSGLAPTIIHHLIQRILEFKEKGSTILWVVEENPLEVLPYADRVYVLGAGEIKAEMPARDLLDDRALQALFFGTET